MSVLNKAGAALTVVFLVSLAALVAEILYVLWRQRSLLRHPPGGETPFPTPPICLFCWKGAQASTRVEPNTEATPAASEPGAEEDGGVLVKWQRGLMCGPSRVLFTIKEEKEEELIEISSHPHRHDQYVSTGVISDVVVLEAGGELGESTPFSTPCASPPYYTPSPSPSPSREHARGRIAAADT